MAKHEKGKKKRWGLIVALTAVGLVVALLLGAVGTVYYILSRATIEPYEKEPTYDGQDMLEHDLPAIDETAEVVVEELPPLEPIVSEEDYLVDAEVGADSATVPDVAPVEPPVSAEPAPEAMTVQKLMKNWCANGQPVNSSQVLNILLIGVDHEDVAINGRADSLILFSVNTQTGTITMASLLRDQYAYTTTGSGEIFEKMHLSNGRGGPSQMIATVEAHYKVQIDNYVMVSLSTFPKIIDRFGGVTITLTEAEVKALGAGFAVGEQRLNGEQALRYSRLRHIDSDANRTGRQRKVLTSLMNELRTASLSDLIGVVNDLLPYVRTGFTQTQMITLAGRAVSEGWLSYTQQQFYTPAGDCWYGAMVDDLFYWIVDYPVAAHDLQMALYGKSNITLAPDRTSFLSCPIR